MNYKNIFLSTAETDYLVPSVTSPTSSEPFIHHEKP